MLLSVPLAVTFAALGARFPDGGGVSTYARRAFGARAATVVGWCFFFAVPVGAPPAAGFAGAYVADAAGRRPLDPAGHRGVLIVLVAAMNYPASGSPPPSSWSWPPSWPRCWRSPSLAALPHAELDRLTPFAPFGWAAVGTAAALLVWAFAGWEVGLLAVGGLPRPGPRHPAGHRHRRRS